MNLPLRLSILSALILGLFFLTTPASVAAFDDLQGHWSGEAVYHAAVLDLISGYPDGSFKPEQSLTQMEAVVLFMRAAGYEPDKKSKKAVSLPMTPRKVPEVSWGEDYINQAVQDNLIEENWLAVFNGDSSISRAQAADLICRLLMLPQAATDPGSLPFNDLDQAPPELRAAIIAVARAGIISGYEDGVFRPGGYLKRGEAASVLDRLIQERWLKITAAREVEGWVQRIDFSRNPLEIELQSLQGSKNYKLAADARCFKNGQPCPYQQIISWKVKIYLDSKKQVGCVTLLEKKSVGQERKITGTVRSVALGQDSFLTLLDRDGKERILPLSWGAELDSGSKSNKKGFQNLKANTFVDVFVDAEEVTRVTVLETKSVSGSVISVSGKRLDLDGKSSSKKPQWFNYPEQARIVDKDGGHEQVVRGDKVKIIYLDPDPDGIDDEIPLEITVTNRPQWKKVGGVVEKSGSSSSRGRQLVMKNKIYELDDSAVVVREDGSLISFSAIMPDDKVEAMIDGAGIIMKITLMDSEEEE